VLLFGHSLEEYSLQDLPKAANIVMPGGIGDNPVFITQ